MTITIIADTRESRSKIADLLAGMPDIEVLVQELPIGDYMLREDFPVERKAAVDFIASIQDRRLFEQVAKMKAEFGCATFILEGDPYTTRSTMSPDAIRGAISYLVAIQGAAVVMTKNQAETAALLAVMARHKQEGLGYRIALRGNKPKDLLTQAQFVVEGFPGVGPTAAMALLAHFGSIAAIFAADAQVLRAAPGIGPKTAQGIRSVLDVECRRSPPELL